MSVSSICDQMKSYNCLIFEADYTSVMMVTDHFETMELVDGEWVTKRKREKCSLFHLIEDSEEHRKEVNRLFLASGTLHFSSIEEFQKWFDAWEPTYTEELP